VHRTQRGFRSLPPRWASEFGLKNSRADAHRATDAVEDSIAGLDHGADDYLTKPFDFANFSHASALLIRRPSELNPAQLSVAN